MFRLTKRVEYALLAVGYMHLKAEEQRANVQEIAEYFELPVMLLAKLMQELKRSGIVVAIHGCRGGYQLAKQPRHIRLLDFLQIFDRDLSVSDCTQLRPICCPRHAKCGIRLGMAELNARLVATLQSVTLEQLICCQELDCTTTAPDR